MSSHDYPAHWEADVVLSDGATARLRPITADDAERLVSFYARVSERSKYYRFFAPYPELSARDVTRFTNVDHEERVALVVLEGENILAVGRFDQLGNQEAEVAFLVEDAHQGRGLGSVLLEHLAQAGRELGVHRFLAEVLPENRTMSRIFQDAGYTARQEFADGVINVEVTLAPTQRSKAVSAAREHRAEARSVQRLLRPSSVAVIGASRSPDKAGSILVRHLLSGGFEGDVYPVNLESATVEGLRARPRVQEIPGKVDLAILAVPAALVPDAVADCAAAGVRGLVVIAGGFAELGTAEGLARQEALVRQAHAHGMRVVGPHCLGLVNTALSLNASLASAIPPAGVVGIFAQSGALGRALLAQAARRDLGISSFVSAGNRADVSANDLLQYWEADTRTRVIGVYLESLGNPRKFSRLARRIARFKPVVAVTSGPYLAGLATGLEFSDVDAAPGGPSEEGEPQDAASPLAVPNPVGQRGVDALFRQAGVIRVATIPELLDVSLLLAHQPLPAGPRVAVIGNSDALGLLAADMATTGQLVLGGAPVDLGPDAGPPDYRAAVLAAIESGTVDAVVAVYARTVGASASKDVLKVLADAAQGSRVTVLVTLPETGSALDVAVGRAVHGVPAYGSPEEAIRALSRVCSLVKWRARGMGSVPALERADVDRARDVAMSVLASAPSGRMLSAEECAALLSCVGLDVLPTQPVSSAAEALDAGAAFGWDVVLKASADHLRARPDQADVWRNIDTPTRMQAAWTQLTGELAPPAEGRYVVQPMAAPGIPVVVSAVEDPSFGPVISFGLAGRAMELVGDRSYRIAPLTDLDAGDMLDEIAAAPLLRGYRGHGAADRDALIELLHRMSKLADEVPEVYSAVLDPVLATSSGFSVINATVCVRPPPSRADLFARRLG